MGTYFEDRMAEIRAGMEAQNPPRGRPARMKPKPLKGTRKGHIYFAVAEGHETVKIGFATNLATRLTALQTGSHLKLHIPAGFRSYIEAEKMLHHRFRSDHIRGEWFRLSSDIEELWDDIFDYQGCHASGRTGREYVDNFDNVFFPLTDLAVMLNNVGTPWQCL